MIDLLETYSIHLFSILLLLVIYILNKLKKDTKTFSMKLFYMILFTNVLLLILEPLSFLTDRSGAIIVHYLNYILDFIIIIFSTAASSSKSGKTCLAHTGLGSETIVHCDLFPIKNSLKNEIAFC